MQNDNTVVSLESDEKCFNTGTSFSIYGKQPSLYTNMKKKGIGKSWGKREAQPVEETEWSHIDKKPRKEEVDEDEKGKGNGVFDDDGGEAGGGGGEEEEEGGGGEEMEIIECGGDTHNTLTKKTNHNYNYQYWSNFYSFLYEKRTFPKPSPPPSLESPSSSSSFDTTTKPPPPSPFNYTLGSGVQGKEIERECNVLLERLLLLSGTSGKEKKEQVFLLLCDYFVPLVKNFYQLIHNSPVIRGVVLDKRLTKAGKEPPVMTPKQVTEAVILHLMTESYQTEDIAMNKIQLWVRNPWLVHLNECGHITRYYTKYLNKNGNTIKRAIHTKNDIKECLSFYFTHSHWLQKFIHTDHYL